MGSVTEDRIVGTGVRALRGNSDAVLEDRVTRPRVAEAKKLDTEKRLALCGKAGALDAIDFVPNVYSILLGKQWLVAADFQRIWLNSPANQLKGSAREAKGTTGPLQVVSVNMDWVLKFERARDAFKQLANPNVFANDVARRVIQDLAEKAFRQNSGATEVQLFDLSKKGQELDAAFVNHREVGGYGDLDELTAALGRVAFFAIPGGTAKRTGPRTYVTVSSVGIYVRDSFDFNGEQQLGWWRLPHDISISAPMKSKELATPTTPRCGDSWFPMSNRVYRRYRERTGVGGDFVIYSDVKEVGVPKPVVFDYYTPQ